MKKFDGLEDTLKPMLKILGLMEDDIETLAKEFMDDSNYYIPMDTKELKKSSSKFSDLKKGLIVWKTVYARRLFYNPQFNFRKDKNPNAQGLWAEKAKSVHGKKYRNIVNKTFKKAKGKAL